MRRRGILATTLAIALFPAIVSPGTEAAGHGTARLTFHQYGVEVDEISAADPFQIRGEGFRPSVPVSICFSGNACLMAEADPTGVFVQNRPGMPAGTYMVTAHQPRSRKLETWLLKTAGKVTITN